MSKIDVKEMRVSYSEFDTEFSRDVLKLCDAYEEELADNFHFSAQIDCKDQWIKQLEAKLKVAEEALYSLISESSLEYSDPRINYETYQISIGEMSRAQEALKKIWGEG